MTAAAASQPDIAVEDFKTGQVATISAGHFVHDTYTAFLAPLLPLLREQLGISLAQAGALSGISQLPSMLNPFIGYLDDRVNLRLLLIIAPAVTATLMSAIGFMPNYPSLIWLLLLVGLSVSALHAIAPALLARVSGRDIGKGMSVFMAMGEMGRTIGPLLITWAASIWSIRDLWPLAIPAWLISAAMFARLWQIKLPAVRRPSLRGMLPQAGRFFVPLTLIAASRAFMISALGTFLPTLVKSQGAALWAAGATLSIYQLAGIGGAMTGGTLSDRLGRRKVLAGAMSISAAFTLVYLYSSGWVGILVLLVLGFSNLSIQPVMLALVQDHFPNTRSIANGIYLGITFIFLSITAVIIGAMGDAVGLHQAFIWCSLIGLAGVPLLFLLPSK